MCRCGVCGARASPVCRCVQVCAWELGKRPCGCVCGAASPVCRDGVMLEGLGSARVQVCAGVCGCVPGVARLRCRVMLSWGIARVQGWCDVGGGWASPVCRCGVMLVGLGIACGAGVV